MVLLQPSVLPHREAPEPRDRNSGEFSRPRRAHLVGIAGAGMRALAEVLLARGWQVSGSDLDVESARCLAAAGVRLAEGHAAGHLAPDAELVVHSDAVPPDNAELRRAAELGIPALSYFAMLGRLSAGCRTLAVAGSHGKSTTTAMAGEILVAAGLDPTVFCGAAPLGKHSGGRDGAGETVLVEACEYRANFLHLRPRHAAILGIEHDHFDCYPTFASLEDAFGRFARSVPADGLLLARHDCPVTRRIAAGAACRTETFGFGSEADWSARHLLARQGRYAFGLFRRGRCVGEVRLRVPGRHNVLNALAAAALAWHQGAEAEPIVQALGRFRGLHRRLELLGTRRGVTLVDDYAHHPTEVAAALAAVRRMFPRRRVWCVFQPHQASRTARLLDELAASLQNADMVLVSDIFRARESPLRGGEVTAADLARKLRRTAARAGRRAPEAVAAGTDPQIGRLLRTRLAPGDVLITMGAGDIRRICDGFLAGIRKNRSAG